MRLWGIGLLAVLGLTGISAEAQVKPINFGFQGGVNLANLTFDPEMEPAPDMLLAFGGGALLSFNVSPNLSLDIDGFYMQKGASYEFEENFGPQGDPSELLRTTIDLKMGYVLLCPMLRLNFASQDASPYLLGGLEVGFLMSAHETGTAEWVNQGTVESEIDLDVKDAYKDTSLGINVGAGLSFPAGSGSFFLEGRYALGLTDIVAEDAGDGSGDELGQPERPTVKHTGIYLTAGIRL